MTTPPPLVLPHCGSPKGSGEFTRRHWVLLLSVLEMLGCLAGASLYTYALACKPTWAVHLVPIPPTLCTSHKIVHGVMYVFVLLFLMEFCQAVCLFDGARRESLARVQFWLSSMLTYLVLVSIVVIGLELGGVRSPTMNSVAFVSIFLRFLEIMIVYAWAEQEAMDRLKLNVSRMERRCLGLGGSTSTINTQIDFKDEPPSPPPSYDSTLPPILSQSGSINSPRPSTSSAATAPTQQRNAQMLPVLVEVEASRTKQWKKQRENKIT